MTSDAPATDDDARSPADSDAAPSHVDVVEAVRWRCEQVADREVAAALRKLEARGDLTDGQRAAVHALADGIVDALVAAPARTVAAGRAADDETLRTVVDLFDPTTGDDATERDNR